MVLVVVLAEVLAGGLVVATLAADLVVATLAALAEAVDSTVAVGDSMAAGGHSTVEAMGPMAAGMGTGAMVTTGTMGTTGIMAIVGVMGTTGTTGTTGTGTTMDIGVGAAGRIRGTVGVGIIRGTAIRTGGTLVMALTTIRPTIIRAVVTMAAITAEQITETAIQTAQNCANCNAGLRGADTTTVLLMEQWVLKHDKQSGLTSVSTVIDIAHPSALIEQFLSVMRFTRRCD